MAGPAAHRAQEPDKGNAPTRREKPVTTRQRQPSPTTMMMRHHRRKSIETPWRARRGERQAPAAHPQAGEGGPHPQPRTAQKRVTFEGAIKREGRDGANSESPQGWRGGEGGWVGEPRLWRTWVAA